MMKTEIQTIFPLIKFVYVFLTTNYELFLPSHDGAGVGSMAKLNRIFSHHLLS